MGVYNAELFTNLGLCCFFAQQYDMTLNCFERALSLASDENMADVWYNIGHVAVVKYYIYIYIYIYIFCFSVKNVIEGSLNSVMVNILGWFLPLIKKKWGGDQESLDFGTFFTTTLGDLLKTKGKDLTRKLYFSVIVSDLRYWRLLLLVTIALALMNSYLCVYRSCIPLNS